MTENDTQTKLTEQEYEQRQERFRYTDLSHPVMQLLFNLQLNSNPPTTSE
ncbi:MAG: hypothetical protein OEY48_04540 [Gammaproteobacteria bacterium]|nr:hypothetical protein [Gammaproteobacteria bacterium]MDH5592097.1 hypothetical protein [Gammaproteobacteria bacterium]